MKYDRRKPCGNCPFRKEAPLAYWHPSHYIMLRRMEQVEQDPQESSLFLCHKDRHKDRNEQGLCIGWLLNQREKGCHSIALRLHLMNHDDAINQYQEAEADGPMYETVTDLMFENLVEDAKLHPERYASEGE